MIEYLLPTCIAARSGACVAFCTGEMCFCWKAFCPLAVSQEQLSVTRSMEQLSVRTQQQKVFSPDCAIVLCRREEVHQIFEIKAVRTTCPLAKQKETLPLDGVSNPPHLHCLFLSKSFSNLLPLTTRVKQHSLSSCQSCPWPTGVEGNIQTLQAMEVPIPPLEDAVGEHLGLRSQLMTTPVHCDGASASGRHGHQRDGGSSCPCAWWRSVMSPSQSERKEIMLAQGQQVKATRATLVSLGKKRHLER